MPRPRKWRHVCSLPQTSRFGPLGVGAGEMEPILMSVDEYEAFRLIDYEGMTQQECSTQMGVARSTVQGIYDSARKKLAHSLVEGKPLLIEGGEYQLNDHGGPYGHGCGRGCRRRERMEEMREGEQV
ncbi:MAG: DUF134 domain-containing protein [Sphaerochaeta sp.]|uniref:DUF134 domain-containing protein n=1 Tax=Sphaerochaeta sp. TaxID=1972642 RepID=UPI001DF00C1E|nr:DUF134 domain-containing protein [Sphaerochaeta sp.]NCC13040.1 DUF134 domain-containing protein [Spirochaetia bacterium]NCC90716.1 DUF134 domain-containing protein [Spirochaetia bacterium]